MKARDVKPINGWVLLLPDKPTSPEGIIIPESVTNYGYSGGTVINVGKSYYPKNSSSAQPTPMPLSIGDRVVCRDYLKDLETVTLDCGECCFIYIDDILCVVPKGVSIE